MKKLLLLPVLCLVSFAALAETTVTIPATPSKIEIPAHTLRMIDIDFGMYKGGYDLANGQVLYLTSRANHMYAHVDDGERMEVVGTRNGFVSLNKQMKINFEQLPNGELGGELLVAKQPQLAGQPVEYVLIAMRR